MKNFFLFTVIILFSTLECLGQDFNISGKWIGSDKDKNIGQFLFDRDSFVILDIQGKLFGGKNFMFNEIETNLKFIIDYQKKPIELELILSKNRNNETIKKLYFIVNIINENEINIGINNNDLTQKPLSFTPENTLHFIRSN